MVTKFKTLKTYTWQYSFVVDGGAIGTLLAPFSLPVGSMPVLFSVNAPTAGTSGGAATVAFGFNSGGLVASLLAATAIASFTTAANLTALPASNLTVAAAPFNPSMTIAAAALTAGIFNCTILYYDAL